MSWTVLFHEEFDLELQALDEDLQDELLAHATLLREFGPQLGRPSVEAQGELPWQEVLIK